MDWKYRHTVLVATTLAFFSTAFGRFVISPVVPSIRAEFAVSNTAIGAALTGMWLAYALVQYPSGVFADRFGERRVILVAIGTTAVVGVAIALSPVFAIFLVGTVVVGAASGLHFTVAATLLSRLYDQTGTAIGIHNAGGPAAGLVAPLVAATIGVTIGWRYAVAFGALIGVATFVLFARTTRSTPPQHPDRSVRKQFSAERLGNVVMGPRVLFSLGLAVISMFVWQANLSFLPTLLVEHRGLSQSLAGLVFGAYFVAQAVLQIGVGSVGDRYGTDVAIGGCLAATAAGFATLALVPGALAIAVGIAFLGIGLGSIVAIMARILEEFSEAERNEGFGLVRTLYLSVASLGSVVVGLFADLFGWTVAIGFLAGLAGVALVGLVVNHLLRLGY